MADHDEGPYVIIERRTGSFGTFVWGLLLGAAAALLVAPKSGRETRRELSEGVDRLRDKAETRARELQRNLNESMDDVLPVHPSVLVPAVEAHAGVPRPRVQRGVRLGQAVRVGGVDHHPVRARRHAP
ncbi:MAG TPA: YtxH domain-containing protein, partial [Longimicrobiales bacterium]|nr:YtxH domain-containing protein [Longimicrobiales bacterium]